MDDKGSEIKEKISEIEFDEHWFRRVFHTFAASFLVYYIIPNESWNFIVKIYLPIIIVIGVFIVEYLRIQGKLDNFVFFGLRKYEEKRLASHLYFGVAILLLFLFFPQQIAVPCILCACFADPIIGETRYRFGERKAYIIGFFICMMFFLISWRTAEIGAVLFVSVIGATAAIIGEVIEEEDKVILRTQSGGERILDMLAGFPLPRIC